MKLQDVEVVGGSKEVKIGCPGARAGGGGRFLGIRREEWNPVSHAACVCERLMISPGLLRGVARLVSALQLASLQCRFFTFAPAFIPNAGSRGNRRSPNPPGRAPTTRGVKTVRRFGGGLKPEAGEKSQRGSSGFVRWMSPRPPRTPSPGCFPPPSRCASYRHTVSSFLPSVLLAPLIWIRA